MVNNWTPSWDTISPVLKHSDKIFKETTLSKNVNSDDKKTQYSEKK